MSILESLRVALGMLRMHKLRAFLTMLGVIIGVMSVTLVVMLSEGFQVFIEQQFESLSPDGIFLLVDPSRLDRQNTTITSLTEDDKRYLQNRAKTIGVISAVGGVPNQTVKYQGEEVRDVSVEAIDENYNQIVKNTLAKGRFIDEQDVRQRANVVVISEEMAARLFRDDEAIGKMITTPGLTLEVIGIMEIVETGGPGGQNPRRMQVPVTTAQRKWTGGRDYGVFMMRPKEGVPVEEAMDDVWQLMMVRSDNKPVYRLDSSASILETFNRIIGVGQMVLAGIAALALLVGGIGIMNIMLVSVTERTKEIGLRKAIGAKRGAILTQFLVEAGTLSLVGGLIGMAIAYGLGQVATIVTKAQGLFDGQGLSAPFPVTAAIGAAVFSALIGMVFGFFPAVSASRLQPIEALRHE
ncbi:MAG: ABC transporter permease [Fimbriimonadaceae bacterium]